MFVKLTSFYEIRRDESKRKKVTLVGLLSDLIRHRNNNKRTFSFYKTSDKIFNDNLFSMFVIIHIMQ